MKEAPLVRDCLRVNDCITNEACKGQLVSYRNQVLHAYLIAGRDTMSTDKSKAVFQSLRKQAHEVLGLFLWDESRQIRFAVTNAFFKNYPEERAKSTELKNHWESESTAERAEQWHDSFLIYTTKKRLHIWSVWCSPETFCQFLKGKQVTDAGCVEENFMEPWRMIGSGELTEFPRTEPLILEPGEFLCTRDNKRFSVSFSEEE